MLVLALIVGGRALCLAQVNADYDRLVQTGKNQLQAGDSSGALETGNRGIKASPTRWEAYALTGGALMNLKRYEEAADQFSEGIRLAPETKKAQLRDLRKQCVLADTGLATPTSAVNAPATAQAAPVTTQAEVVLWKSIEGSQRASDFEGYLRQYPAGAFNSLAKGRLEEINAEQARQQDQKQVQLAAEQTKREDAARAAWQSGESFTVRQSKGLIWGGSGKLTINSGGVTYTGQGRSLKDAFSATCSNLKWKYDGFLVDFQVMPTKAHIKLASSPDGTMVLGDEHLHSVLQRYCSNSMN